MFIADISLFIGFLITLFKKLLELSEKINTKTTIITFLSLWLIRFINTSFAYLVILSSTLMYLCWFVMIGVAMYELILKKD